MWAQILTAVALVLVLEGIAPFINPGGYKKAMSQVLKVPDRQLRTFGLGSMLIGLVLLQFVH